MPEEGLDGAKCRHKARVFVEALTPTRAAVTLSSSDLAGAGLGPCVVLGGAARLEARAVAARLGGEAAPGRRRLRRDIIIADRRAVGCCCCCCCCCVARSCRPSDLVRRSVPTGVCRGGRKISDRHVVVVGIAAVLATMTDLADHRRWGTVGPCSFTAVTIDPIGTHTSTNAASTAA